MRPESFEDLPEMDRQGEHVLTVNPDRILSLPTEAVTKLLETMDILEEIGRVTIVGSFSHREETKVYVKYTEEEQKDLLKRAQQTWDYRMKSYEEALENPNSIEDWRHYSINSFAKENGFEGIDFGGENE